jgi:peptide/nickel transport system permease protein
MPAIVARRVLIALPLLFVVSVLTFVLERLAPGNPVETILSNQAFGGAGATKAEYVALAAKMGLNHPLWLQYWDWLHNAVLGNLGASLFSGQSVTAAVESRLPVTLSLVIGGVLVSAVVGGAIGIVGAVRGSWMSKSLDALGLIGFAIPSFWLGLALIELLAVKTAVFPATGYVSISASVGGWARSLVLPVIALGVGGIAVVARQMRDAMASVLQRDFVRNLRANGFNPWSIVLKHALRNAAAPVITVLALLAVGFLSGSVIIESVFALPGLGGLAVQAATQHDTPTVQGVVLFMALIVIALNLVLDIAYAWLNPKARRR